MKMKKLLISSLITSDIRAELEKNGYIPKTISSSDGFSSELGYHADVNVCQTPFGLVTSKPFFEKNRSYFDEKNVLISKSTPRETYPNDVVFNGAFVGETLIASKYICDEISSNSKKIITVKQGYAKCSCAVAKNSVITADDGIAEKLKINGIDHLKIDCGYVSLRGFSCGFIGGASFFEDDILFTFGNVKKHKNGTDIISFLKNINVSVVSLGNNELYDYGGAIVI